MVKARHELYDRMSDDDRKLLAEAEGRYAELSDGFIGEQEFKRLLDPYLVPVVQQLPKAKAAGAVASVLTSSNSSSNVAARYGSTDDWNQRNYVFNLPRELTLSHSS